MKKKNNNKISLALLMTLIPQDQPEYEVEEFKNKSKIGDSRISH